MEWHVSVLCTETITSAAEIVVLADEIASAYREHERTGDLPRTPIGLLVKRSFIKVFETDDFEDEGELTALVHFMMLTNIFDYESWEGRGE